MSTPQAEQPIECERDGFPILEINGAGPPLAGYVELIRSIISMIAYCLMPTHYHLLARQDGEKPAVQMFLDDLEK